MAKTLKLWIDTDSGYLYQTFNSSSSLPKIEFLQGDKVDVEVHLVKIVNGFMNEVAFPSGSVLRMAVGKIDASATSGTYTIAYNGQTTSPLSYSATEAQIQTALNALSTITSAGGVTVSKFSDSMFSISFNAVGTNYPFEVDGSLLNPPCATKSITLKTGSGSVKGECLIKVKQSPVAYQDSFSDLTSSSISTTVLTANQSKRVTIYPEPRAGTWSITGTGDLQRKVIASNDGVLDPAWWDENYTARVSINALATDTQFTYLNYDVAKVDNFTWDFSLKPYATPPVGYTMPFTVSGSGLIGFTGKVGNLDLNTAEVEYLLNGSASVTTNLELELEETGGNKRTLLQTTCTIKNDLIDQTNFSPLSFTNEAVWGDIGGTISNQTDLQSALDGKLSLTGGTMTGQITFSTDGTNDSLIGAWGLGVENTSNEAATVEPQQITIYDSVSGKGTAITKTGITLAESVFAGGSPSTIIGNARQDTSYTGFNLKTDVDANGARIQITFGNDDENYENQANLTQSGLEFKDAVSETIFAKYDTSGVTFPDATHQTTAALPLTGGELSGSLLVYGAFNVYSGLNQDNNFNINSTSGKVTVSGVFGKTEIGEFGLGYSSFEYSLDDSVQISAGSLSVMSHSTLADPNTPLVTTKVVGRGIVFSDLTEQLTAGLPLTGGTLTGKLNLNVAGTTTAPLNLKTGITPTTPLAGDVWIYNDSLNYRNTTGVTRIVATQGNNNAFTNYQSITASNNANPALTVTQSGNGGGLKITNTGTGESLRVEDETSPDATPFVVSNSGRVGIGVSPDATVALYVDSTGIKFNGSATAQTVPYIASDVLLKADNLSGLANQATARTNLGLGSMATETASNYALLSGATFTGKVNISAGATTSPMNIGAGISPSGAGTAGDLWIGTTNLSWKDSTNTTRVAASTSSGNNFTQNQTITVTSAGSPSLTVIQNGNGGGVLVQNPTGTGYSFKVEDSTSPDATPFTVDASGRVGIGITPDATSALNVDSTGIKFNSSTAQTVPFLPPPSDGNYYVYRNGSWTMATIFTSGGKNYLTI